LAAPPSNLPGASYYNPRNLLDYTAVIGTTLAYLFLGAALMGLFRQQPLTPSWKQKIWLAGILIAIAAAGAVGISNFTEDALGLKAFGNMFFIGGVGLMFGLLLAAAGAFLHSEFRWRLGLFLLACMVGIAFPDSGGWFVTGAVFLIMGWRK
jgi:hypothetical protein